MIELLPIEAVTPSTYNPRSADPRRLDLIELSLRKLGFLLPIYVDAGADAQDQAGGRGEILSGHQRHLVATRMGVTRVPVAYTRPMTLPQRKATNIAFNRGTNDLNSYDTPADLTEALERSNVYALAEALPDLPIDEPAFYPCLEAKDTPIEPLLETNKGRWVQYARSVSKLLYEKGILMPIICTPDGMVVNGIGRLQLMAEKKAKVVQVVTIPYEAAAFAGAMLNLLSMDFDLHRRYADLLRHNSFRRASLTTAGKYLGQGFIFVVAPNKSSRAFDIRDLAQREQFVQIHGTSILDFGAGHGDDTRLLREVGLDVTEFEPYRLAKGTEQIDRDESRRIARAFFADVAAGKRWRSIFLAAVLNSVPFEQDRKYIVQLCAALAGRRTKLYAQCIGAKGGKWKGTAGEQALSREGFETRSFVLGYEPHVTIGELYKNPKMQKFHTPAEFYDVFAPFWNKVSVTERGGRVEAICWDAKTPDPAYLRAAIEFEFNLPYPDGQRMDLVEEALAAYSQRLGLDLASLDESSSEKAGTGATSTPSLDESSS